MAKEIERKFIVLNGDWKYEQWASKGAKIQQGYLSKTPKHVVRVRTYEQNGESTAFLTVKGKRVGMSRAEYEYEIPFNEGKALIKLCDGAIVRKTRYEVIVDKVKWEVDVFAGLNRGFTMAEVELQSARQKIMIPKWAGQEVTYDNRFSNTYLATHKAPFR